jgi:hypothetical protein
MNIAYERGLHELGDGLDAYLQPDGGWGWSNAGLITADGTGDRSVHLLELGPAHTVGDAIAYVPPTWRTCIESSTPTCPRSPRPSCSSGWRAGARDTRRSHCD